MRIDIAPGPELDLHADTELGANWKGYPHADPVVQSLQAVATVELKTPSVVVKVKLSGPW